MVHGQQMVVDFIRLKSQSGNTAARRRWHGHFIGVGRSSALTIAMFTELEMHLISSGWAAYGWAYKSDAISRKLYQRGVTSSEYSQFPLPQNHWISFYCSRDISVARGYRVPGATLLRIYVKRARSVNIWNTGLVPLDDDTSAGVMIEAQAALPIPRFFGITGPQSALITEPETAMFGSEINSSLLCVPFPESISDIQLNASMQLSRIVEVSAAPVLGLANFLATIR